MSNIIWRIMLNNVFRISITINACFMQHMFVREDNAYSCDDDDDDENEAGPEDENDDEADDEDDDDDDEDDDDDVTK